MATKYYLMAITQRDGEEKGEQHVVEAILCRYCWVPVPAGVMTRRHRFWHQQTGTDRGQSETIN